MLTTAWSPINGPNSSTSTTPSRCSWRWIYSLHLLGCLTTRWSRPGQPEVEFGAILTLAGRAAHLDAVRQPVSARSYPALTTRNLTYNSPSLTYGPTSHYATQGGPALRRGLALPPALPSLLAGPLSDVGRETSHPHVGFLCLRGSRSLAPDASPPLA